MNGIIFELEEKSKYTGRYMDEEISYNDPSIDYMEEIQECDKNSEIKALLNDPCLGKIRAQTNGLELIMNYHINQIRLNVNMPVN